MSACTYLSEPELEILDGSGVHPLSVGLLELVALLGGLAGEELPLFHQLLYALLYGDLRARALLLVNQL